MPPPRPSKRSETPLRVPVERAIEHCRVFVDGVMQRGEYRPAEAVRMAREQGGYVWLGLHEPDERQMLGVAEEFGIHELIVEDAVTAHQRPKVERYDDQIFFVVRSVEYNDDDTVRDSRDVIETLGEVQMLVGPDFIITVRHDSTLPGINRIDRDQELARLGPSALSYLVADYLVEQYVRIVGLLEHEVDTLEEEVFTPGVDINVDKIYMFKREVLEMRHATDPLAPALNLLIKDHKDLIPKQIRSYFRDVLDNELHVRDQIAGFDERLTSLIDASVAKVTMQQNRDMRTISAFVGMAAVPTLIAGIYGMNFEVMPELQWEYGYYVVLTIIVVVIAVLWWLFRRNKWL
ncbi:magnesium and cobalt transport protein CorA [Corynebacterium maris]|uniref:magnesium and cobalt transport protein CorA n=1 Tax=Corynebacterium maris TaxID=575200 RepID=UPI0004150288|nr:magnesium and cobalt transport protein CorA [Corynebacterium maris]